MRTTIKLAAGLIVLGLAFSLGAGAMLLLLYDRTGRALMWRLDRELERFSGDSRSGPAEELWASGRNVSVRVVEDTAGYDLPVRIVFAPNPPTGDRDPLYYVGEMGGRIKVVAKDRSIHTFADELINFTPGHLDELGMLGLEIDPSGEFIYITLAYWDEDGGVYRNRVDRLRVSDDGMRMTEREVLLDMKDEMTVASYQIQFVSVGPDDLLYVGVGSGADKTKAMDLDWFAGKVIRMTKSGAAVESNPFYDPQNPDSPRSYVYAYGFRNPFDIAWVPGSSYAIVSDVGPVTDRIVRLEYGASYGFADHDDQMRLNALYTWGPNEGVGYSPVGVDIIDGSVLGIDHDQVTLVGLYGNVYTPGPTKGKRVVYFEAGPGGYLRSHARDVVVYEGTRFASVVDVAAGPDGVYFTDLLGESIPPHRGGGVVYRIEPGEPVRLASDGGEHLTGSARGRWVYEQNQCSACHVRDGRGNHVGPELTNLRTSLLDRLTTETYEDELRSLMSRPGRFFQDHRDWYETLLEKGGDERVEAWLRYHLLNPRFDHPGASMPSFAHLAAEDLDSLLTYLLGSH